METVHHDEASPLIVTRPRLEIKCLYELGNEVMIAD